MQCIAWLRLAQAESDSEYAAPKPLLDKWCVASICAAHHLAPQLADYSKEALFTNYAISKGQIKETVVGKFTACSNNSRYSSKAASATSIKTTITCNCNQLIIRKIDNILNIIVIHRNISHSHLEMLLLFDFYIFEKLVCELSYALITLSGKLIKVKLIMLHLYIFYQNI
jgi:hypothetical protein